MAGTLALTLLAAGAALALDHVGAGRRLWYPLWMRVAGAPTLEGVRQRIQPLRRPALVAACAKAGLPYPPRELTLVAYKEERLLEVWGRGDGAFARLAEHPILAASGGPGPKLRQGDLQVPEGIYRLTALNPASSYHLSIRVDYPSAFDRARAAEERRTDLGGDIFVHGRSVSIGCIAIGDPAIEEVFLLVADVGLRRSRILIAPNRAVGPAPASPAWVGRLYADLRRELQPLQR
jgi:hypothetical protein